MFVHGGSEGDNLSAQASHAFLRFSLNLASPLSHLLSTFTFCLVHFALAISKPASKPCTPALCGLTRLLCRVMVRALNLGRSPIIAISRCRPGRIVLLL